MSEMASAVPKWTDAAQQKPSPGPSTASKRSQPPQNGSHRHAGTTSGPNRHRVYTARTDAAEALQTRIHHEYYNGHIRPLEPGPWGEIAGQPLTYSQHPRTGVSVHFAGLEITVTDQPIDVAPEVAATGEPHQRPAADAVFGSVCSFEAWPSVPIRVVVGADDRFFPVEFQRTLARDRLRVEADVLPGGHLIGLARPLGLAKYLLNV